MQDQGGLAGRADRLDVGAEVLDPGRDDGVGGDGRAAPSAVFQLARHGLLADARAEVLVEVVEVLVEVREPGEAVAARAASAMPSKTSCGTPSGLSSACTRNGSSEARNASLATRSWPWLLHVAGELAGAHREADEDDVAQVEGLEHGVQVGREGVVVVARATLLDWPKPRRS